MKRAIGLALLALTVGMQEVRAQGHRLDVGLNAGLAYWTKALDGEDTGGDGAKFGPGWLLGGQATLWPTSRIGIRGNALWTERSIKQSGDVLAEGVNLFGLTGNVLFRLREPGVNSITPFIAVGAGARWVRPEGENFAIDFTNMKYWEGTPFETATGEDFFAGELTTKLGLVSVGADIGRSWYGARVEIGDRIFHPHLHRIVDAGGTDPLQRIIVGDGDDKVGPLVHELFAQVGVNLRVGGSYPERAVAVVPPPPAPQQATPTPPPAPRPTPPPPAPAATPTPPPAPACVAEPASRRAIDTASWYTSGAPIRVSAGSRALEWQLAGSPENLTGELVALGTVDGIVMFARASDVGAIRGRFDGRAGTPIATTLGTDRALWTALEDVRTTYVSVESSGCRFQPLQVRRPVTKG